MWLRALLLALSLAATGMAARAEDHIKSLRTEIEIAKNGTLAVTDTITILSEGKAFRHGLQRFIPLGPASSDNLPGVRFEITDVTRDGKPEYYRTGVVANTKRVYLGKEDELLPPGEHTYRLTYSLDNQIQSEGQYDIFLWHVTGKQHSRIEHVEARVKLPNGTRVLATEQRADSPEMSSNNATLTIEGGTLVFRSIDPLESGAPFIFKIFLPKNSIERPH